MYDIQVIQNNNTELLVLSGDIGSYIYKWSDVEECIPSEGIITTPNTVHIQPITIFHPHPSPSDIIEINSTSYDSKANVLYGAAGDAFGCYQWDLETETLLGTFGGRRGGAPQDYLHVVKVTENGVLTGGEDGTMGFWSGKETKLIQLFDIQDTMNKNKQLVIGQSVHKGGFLNNSSVWSHGSNLWISSIEQHGNWLAVGGGAEHGHNGITSRSSSTPATSGFMTMWHSPTRSFTSGCVTRENIHAIVYNPSLDLFVTGANECRISYWESTSAKRLGRAWCSSSAIYAMSMSVENGMMIAGGCGGVLDCYVDQMRVSQLRI